MKEPNAICHCGKKFFRPLRYIKLGRMKSCSKKCGYVISGRKQLGEKHHSWKGNDVGYHALHDYIKYHFKKIDRCQRCNQYKKLDLSNNSGQYKRDLNDWEWLCKSCHAIKDKLINNLGNYMRLNDGDDEIGYQKGEKLDFE